MAPLPPAADAHIVIIVLISRLTPIYDASDISNGMPSIKYDGMDLSTTHIEFKLSVSNSLKVHFL